MFVCNVSSKNECHRPQIHVPPRGIVSLSSQPRLPARTSCGSLTVSRELRKQRVCFDQSNQILARLNRTKRENVIALDAVSLSNSFQFSFIRYRKKFLGCSLGGDRDSLGRNLYVLLMSWREYSETVMICAARRAVRRTVKRSCIQLRRLNVSGRCSNARS